VPTVAAGLVRWVQLEPRAGADYIAVPETGSVTPESRLNVRPVRPIPS